MLCYFDLFIIKIYLLNLTNQYFILGILKLIVISGNLPVCATQSPYFVHLSPTHFLHFPSPSSLS